MVSDSGDGIYRSVIAALTGLVLISATPQQGGKKQTENPKAETNVGNGPPSVAPQPADPVEVAQTSIYDRPCDQGSDNRQSDLCAQWKAADAASDAAWWAMVATAITAIGTFGLYWQIKLTREAVEDTGDATAEMVKQTKISEAAQRPYMHVESMGWHKPKFGRNWVFILKIKNFGQTPASGFSVSADANFPCKTRPPNCGVCGNVKHLIWSRKPRLFPSL